MPTAALRKEKVLCSPKKRIFVRRIFAKLLRSEHEIAVGFVVSAGSTNLSMLAGFQRETFSIGSTLVHAPIFDKSPTTATSRVRRLRCGVEDTRGYSSEEQQGKGRAFPKSALRNLFY